MTGTLAQDRSARPDEILRGFSLEITAKDADALGGMAHRMAPGGCVAITYLPDEPRAARVAAARRVRQAGLEPVPHFSARRMASHEELAAYLHDLVTQAQVTRCFIVAGDPDRPQGPFADSAQLLATGLFERAGITAIGIAGHPDGHPHMDEAQCLSVLRAKIAMIADRGMAPYIVTQFGFDALRFVDWIDRLRAAGIDAPIRIGVPGPAGIKTLLRFAARCGVGASASVMAKYGVSLSRLMGNAGPDRMLDLLRRELAPRHGDVALHFYPFGGVEKTLDWIAHYQARP